jgi:hypothetical protein
MKFAVGLTLAALATLLPAQAAPGRIDVSKRAPRVSTEEKAVLPENQPLERNEVLMDKRVETETIPHKEAVVGERRSDIAVGETREKQIYSAPEQKKFDVIERKESAWAGKKSRYSTSEDAYRSKVAVRFQDKIGTASPISRDVKPVASQRTTFDKINRFVFRKNSDQGVSVTRAGSERPGGDAAGASSPAAVSR